MSINQLQIHHNKTLKLFIHITLCSSLFAGSLYFLHPWTEENVNAETTASNTELSILAASEPSTPIPHSTGSVVLEVSPTIDGAYVGANDTVTVDNSTNNGYDLYISASTDSSSLFLNGNRNSARINTTESAASQPKALKLNTYGYAVSKDADGAVYTGFDSSYDHPNQESVWAAMPASGSSDMIQSISGTGDGKIDVYYGAYVNNAVPSGSYTGSVTYSAFGHDSDYTPNTEITNEAAVYPNSGAVGDAVQLNIVTSLHTVANVGTVTVTVGGKTCTSPIADTSTGVLTVTCTVPTDLVAGEYNVVVSVPSYSKTYTVANAYEVVSTLRSGLYMQDITKDMCKNTKIFEQTGADYNLIDRRDNNIYRVRKLKDGNCWMVQNLRLEGSRKLTTSDSNVLNNNFTLPASTESWCNANNATCYNTNQVLYTGNPEYGTYYSWHAATAGTGTASMASGNATSSICPKSGNSNTTAAGSWHLPTGGTNGEFYTLYAAYQSDYGWTNLDGSNDDMAKSAYQNIGPALTYSGYRHGANTNGQGNYGLWWSSSAYNDTQAYRASINSSTVAVRAGTIGNTKWYGFSVRCLLSSS